MSNETGQQGFRQTGAFQEDELKICDLCGSLNLATNAHCYTCGWTGHFECRQSVVRTAVEIVIQRHGRIELQNLTDMQAYRESRPGFFSRISAWFNCVWRWLSG